MRYVIFDLEATCDVSGFPTERMETIEIGAVCLAEPDGKPVAEFGAFIQPVATQTLSGFCRELTGITQADVDGAEPFYTVFPRFVEWCGTGGSFTTCSWGAYDPKQLRRDCERHAMVFPESMEAHINLKREFARLHGTRPLGMMGALRYLEINPEGRHHRGIDDARNIARIAARILPRIVTNHE